MPAFRTEADTLGPVQIPAAALWGPQTERSRHNFPTGQFMPLAIIRALLNIKKAAAQANLATDQLSPAKGQLIVQAIDELLALDDEALRQDFPLKVYQTGSGTQTNMNVNEVVANKCKQLQPELPILPNDDVNRGQSSNDTFPTAMNIVAVEALDQLLPAVQHLIDELKVKQDQYWHTVKVGRTHLQDATPLTFGQEVSGYVAALEHDLAYLQTLAPTLLELAIGAGHGRPDCGKNECYLRAPIHRPNQQILWARPSLRVGGSPRGAQDPGRRSVQDCPGSALLGFRTPGGVRGIKSPGK